MFGIITSRSVSLACVVVLKRRKKTEGSEKEIEEKKTLKELGRRKCGYVAQQATAYLKKPIFNNLFFILDRVCKFLLFPFAYFSRKQFKTNRNSPAVHIALLCLR